MKALKARQRYDAEQRDKQWEERQQAEVRKIAEMSPEERKIYLAGKHKRQQNAISLLTTMQAMVGPYIDI